MLALTGAAPSPYKILSRYSSREKLPLVFRTSDFDPEVRPFERAGYLV
jgi:hypothetical protein